MKTSADVIVTRMVLEVPELKEKLGTRVFPDVAPDGTESPWLAYQRIGSQDTNDHDGFADLSDESYQLTVWSKDARERRQLGELLNRTFRMKEVEVDGTVAVVRRTDDRYLSEDGPPRLYGVQIDISVSL